MDVVKKTDKLKINKPTAAQCSTIDSFWTSNQQQIVNRKIAKREKRKFFPKKETIVNEASYSQGAALGYVKYL